MSIGYISRQAKGKGQEATGRINNQSLTTGFGMIPSFKTMPINRFPFFYFLIFLLRKI
ncbi:MAG: hypothetical protein IM462_08445 [Microcystis sp. M144S2]|uniref:hypothetical protein n=1 Tax=unclassified Microcystis TaxID=2643300 RepID=UPI002588A21D|nr:hypothetical protein [Microcystis sp. M034S2]MCA2750587.1 hypothetical protein [Microcystis sp. M144S2]